MVFDPESTCWSVIENAARGNRVGRDGLARRYREPVNLYLTTRWANSPLRSEAEDAVQDVFVELFKNGGALEAVKEKRVISFRGYLFGLTRNVARRFESRARLPQNLLSEIEASEKNLEEVFARSWARGIMLEAGQLHQRRAGEIGPEAQRRVELLRLRFEENLPIRIIAERWAIPPTRLHYEYKLARQEYRAALLEVVAFHHSGTPQELEQEAQNLLSYLS